MVTLVHVCQSNKVRLKEQKYQYALSWFSLHFHFGMLQGHATGLVNMMSSSKVYMDLVFNLCDTVILVLILKRQISVAPVQSL